MNLPKKHHVVPQMILRRFCDDSGKLWVFNKKAPEIGVSSGRPEATFYRKHYYSLEEGNTKDPSLERSFAKLEGAADKVIEKICTAARADKRPDLTEDEKGVWDLFVYYQWRRSPDSITATGLAVP